MIAEVDRAAFREAMRRTASGVAVLATDGTAGRAGLTVSTLCSLSMEPPSVIVSVHGKSAVAAVLLANGGFTANILADSHSEIACVFAGLVPEHRGDRFAVGNWCVLPSGQPVLADALCSFDCRIANVFEFGSHKIIVAVVHDIRTGNAEPLIFLDRTFRRLCAA